MNRVYIYIHNNNDDDNPSCPEAVKLVMRVLKGVLLNDRMYTNHTTMSTQPGHISMAARLYRQHIE